MAGLLDWVDPAREWFKGRPEAVKGLLGAVYQMATDPQAREAAMARAPKPFTDESAAKYQASAEGFWNPAGLLGTFAGVNAKTANKAALEVAQKMDKAGADRGAIWNETGWFKGPDSKWRFEINDKPAGVRGKWLESDFSTSPNKYASAASETVGPAFKHDDLYAAYPDLANTKYGARFEYGPDTRGHVNHLTGEVNVGSAGGEFDPVMKKISAAGFGYDKAQAKGGVKSSTLHELQHAIQNQEGFAQGGMPSEMDWLLTYLENNARKSGDINTANYLNGQAGIARWDNGMQAYQRLAGEAEARAVQSRMNMTPAERKAKAPWESYDIPWDKLIVRY